MEVPRVLVDPEVDEGPGDEPPGHDAIILFAVFFEGGLAPFSLFLGWWLRHPPLLHFAWDFRAVLLGAAAALPPALAFLAILKWPVGPFRNLRKFCYEEFVPLLGGSSWADIALIAISAGVGEEMLFRGVFQSALSEFLGMEWGLVLSSLLFGMLHPISISYASVSFSMGLYLGTLYLRSENLLASIAAHAVYDFILMAYLIQFNDQSGSFPNPIAEIDSDHEIDRYDP